MSPFALAGDDVFQAIAVDVGEIDRVELRERDAVFCLLVARIHQQVLDEARARLLEPRESPTVRL